MTDCPAAVIGRGGADGATGTSRIRSMIRSGCDAVELSSCVAAAGERKGSSQAAASECASWFEGMSGVAPGCGDSSSSASAKPATCRGSGATRTRSESLLSGKVDGRSEASGASSQRCSGVAGAEALALDRWAAGAGSGSLSTSRCKALTRVSGAAAVAGEGACLDDLLRARGGPVSGTVEYCGAASSRAGARLRRARGLLRAGPASTVSLLACRGMNESIRSGKMPRR